MSEQSLLLKLPFIQPSQAQKHLTHNEAINALDYLVQMSAFSRQLNTPPLDPNEGDRYIVGPNPTGPWQSATQAFAIYQDTAWRFLHPLTGWQCYLHDEKQIVLFDGATWIPTTSTSIDQLGIGTSTDETQRFAAQTDSALWTALPEADGGNGGIMQVMNKLAPNNDAGIAFQTNYETHALFGSFGSEYTTLKTSRDGVNFVEALSVDNETGRVSHPQTPRFRACVNYRQEINEQNWQKIGFNDAEYNDQLCFDPVNNVFVAPESGTYVLGIHAIYEKANSNSARLRCRLTRNSSDVIQGTTREVSSGHLTTKTGLDISTLVSLSKGDTVEAQANYRNAIGYLMANETVFWGYKVA